MMDSSASGTVNLNSVKTHTLYFCGTMYDRNSDDLIASLYRYDVSQEFDIQKDKVEVREGSTSFKTILDGVGSKEVINSPDSFGDTYNQKSDIARATSMDNKIEDCQTAVANTQPQRINIIGYSRGAVAALKTAQLLCGKYDVRVFAIDPVPGPQIAAPTLREISIPARVKSAVIILALHENHKFFRYFIPERENGARVDVLVFPGIHFSPVAKKQHYAKGLNTVGVLVRDHAEQALSKWGTPLDTHRCLKLTSLTIVEKYAKLIVKYENYKQLSPPAWWSDRGPTEALPRYGDLGKGETNPLDPYKGENPVFINNMHMFMFKHHFPTLFRGITCSKAERGNLDWKVAKSEFQQLKSACPLMAKVLGWA